MAPILLTILLTTIVNNTSTLISSPSRPLGVCEEIAIELHMAIKASLLTPQEANEILNRCHDLKEDHSTNDLYVHRIPRAMGNRIRNTITT